MGTVIGSHEVVVDLIAGEGDLRVHADDLPRATGWTSKTEGLCRGDVCVPLTRDADLVDAAGTVSIRRLAAAVGWVAALDVHHEVVVLAPGGGEQGALRPGVQAPDVELVDLDGRPRRLSEWSGGKRALVAWASWCGCRHELAAWQALRQELGGDGFEIVSVALDDGVEAARPWVDQADPAPEFPVLVDPDHRIVEAFGIVNVPSVVWIDDDDRVVRLPVIAPGDDQFRDFTEIDSSVHHDQLRTWVRHGTVPAADPAHGSAEREGLTDELRQARVERRLGAWLHRRGHHDAAVVALERAVALAPLDFTVSRSSMWQRGADPFGTEFFDLWDRWVAAGRPGYTSAGPASAPPPQP